MTAFFLPGFELKRINGAIESLLFFCRAHKRQVACYTSAVQLPAFSPLVNTYSNADAFGEGGLLVVSPPRTQHQGNMGDEPPPKFNSFEEEQAYYAAQFLPKTDGPKVANVFETSTPAEVDGDHEAQDDGTSTEPVPAPAPAPAPGPAPVQASTSNGSTQPAPSKARRPAKGNGRPPPKFKVGDVVQSKYPPDADNVFYAAKVVEVVRGGQSYMVVYTDPEFEGEPPEPVKPSDMKAVAGSKPKSSSAPSSSTAAAASANGSGSTQTGAKPAPTRSGAVTRITPSQSNAAVMPEADALEVLKSNMPFWDDDHTFNVSGGEATINDLVRCPRG